MKDKKRIPLKDRPGWQKFKEILPDLAGSVADVIPGGGIIKVIMKSIMARQMEKDQRERAMEFLTEPQNEEVDYDETMMFADMASARSKEIELSKDGNRSYFMHFYALVMISLFSFVMVKALIWGLGVKDTERDLVFFLLGNLVTQVVQIGQYHYGTTATSGKKTDTINTFINKLPR